MKTQLLPALAGLFAIAACSAVTACDKNSSAKPDEANDVVKAYDKANPDTKTGLSASASKTPAAPIPGVNLSKLDAGKTKLYNKLVDSLSSPCGKAHSLRKSAAADAGCKRGRFAARYVVALIADEADGSEIRDLYKSKYAGKKQNKFSYKDVPHVGSTDAPVVLVEFFDYGCPACKKFKPLIEEIEKEFPSDVVVFYKHFPLSAHPDSQGAAQAAMAAAKQGKFKEMHNLLFQDQHAHQVSKLRKYAESIGLDMAQYEADFKAAKAHVDADRREGEAAGVMGTPALYINGRPYEAPAVVKYLKMWVDEELAVNR